MVCKDICIPISETKNLNLNLQNVVQSDIFMESYKTVPKRNSNYFNIDENIVSSEKCLLKTGLNLNNYGYKKSKKARTIEKKDEKFQRLE